MVQIEKEGKIGMRVCLINPPYERKKDIWDEEARNNAFSGYTLPHLGIGYIAAVLEKAGYSVDIIECMAENLWSEDCINLIKDGHYDIIGISVYDTNRKETFKFVDLIEKYSNTSYIVFGGYTSTLNYESLLKVFRKVRCCCILGEGEYTFLDIVRNIERKGSVEQVEGIAFYKNGKVIKTSKRELINNLDDIPFPKRKFVSKYIDLSMIASRGCRGNCLYCSIVNFYHQCTGMRYRRRTAKNVVDEMEYLKNKYKDIRTITFFDDNFLDNIGRDKTFFDEFCSMLKERKVDIPFAISACVKDVNVSYDILKKLKELGLYKVFIGVESFNQRQLDFYNKNINVEDNINAIKLLQSIGLKISIGMIAFDPFVTVDEIINNFSILKELKVYNGSHTPFSLHTYLIAVNNTPVQTLLRNKNLYVNNEKGYIFQSDYIEELHTYVKKWNQYCMKMIVKDYFIDMHWWKGEIDVATKYEYVFEKLVDKDLEYVIELSKSLKNNLNTSEFDKIYLKYTQYIDVLYKELESYIELFEQNSSN